MPSPVLQARSRLANAVRAGDKQGEEHARRELAMAKLEAAIENTLAAAPPLTDEQRDRITTALQPRKAVSSQ